MWCLPASAADVVLHLSRETKGRHGHMPPAVAWLTPLVGSVPPARPSKYTLLQKNKMFSPHLLIVPVGSTVNFPNADPFFHNVFSLFDGRRFDLGLYEAGSMRTVTFPREGVSYIFCNIHPDMSAVVLSLSTPYVTAVDDHDTFRLRDVPAGAYELHLWVEGRRDDSLNHLTRHVTISEGGITDLGTVELDKVPEAAKHLNKFGKPYDTDSKTY